jgi:predicted component of type VI protein secretion system
MVYLRSLDDTIQIAIKDGDNLLVGRLPACDQVLEDGSVSSQHARLRLKGKQLRLIDMGSSNGTRVNYILIHEPVYLLDGDTIEFGSQSFTVDGPHLEKPGEAPEYIEPIVDLEPIENPQDLSETMRNIPLPSEAELAAYKPTNPPRDAEESAPETKKKPSPTALDLLEKVEASPVWVAFGLSLILLLLSGFLMLGILWKNPTSF